MKALNRSESMKSLTPEQREERKRNIQYDRERRKEEKEEKARERQRKLDCKRELAVLKFMLSTDVLHHHHGQKDSTIKQIKEQIALVKETGTHVKYDPYIWNYQGEGKNTLPRCQFGQIWSSSEFESIYDVPLDGTYRFHSYDSGQRGLGSFNYITATKVLEEVKVSYVNPGAIIPITV
jgi:hypothetical protein